MAYSVKQVADLAGVSTRTLHYYDQIGLLKASSYGQNGYRSYNEEAVLRLQQILFFRELDFSLAEIQAIIDGPEFDTLEALQAHRRVLLQRKSRLSDLIQTVDRTILHLKGTITLETKDLFVGFDEAQQQRYEQEIAQKFGEARVKESRRRFDSYSTEQKRQIGAEGEAIYRDLLGYIGQDAASPEVQQIVARWHQHIRYFYEPTREVLSGLGQAYAQEPGFIAFYQRMHPELPEFLSQAIMHYCERLPAGA
jgi:MerR family transcriptional regulator, thiopeptide resistance regulator